jgi:small ligand-binding sensory domain FIST
MFVTRVDGRVIHELDGRRPLDVLQELVEQADAHDRRLFGHSLFLGVVMREQQPAYGQGDFLIRNIVGLDGERGALAVAALVEAGAVVQFHLRDAKTSADDLDGLLGRQQGPPPAGALLFSCLGRGAYLYGHPEHDTQAFRRVLGAVPLGGFFCNGEIGPVQGATFLHGYTSAFGLFRPARRP